MEYLTYVPPPPLDGFIEQLWYWRSESADHAKDTIMASRHMGLQVNLAGDELRWYDGEGFATTNRLRGIGLCGTQGRHFAIDAHHPHMLGVQFRPGGAWPFFGPPARDLRNSHVSLADIWGASAHSLHAQLVEAPTPREKFRIMLDALVARAPRDLAHHPAVALALSCFARAPLSASVRRTAEMAELSQKKFIRLFADEVGLTPKLFLRVTRFQRLLGRVWQSAQVDWAPVAAAHGYYDQPHLIRDFREFSGFTPGEYLRRRGPYQQHVPLPS